jgi:hypothetical protein
MKACSLIFEPQNLAGIKAACEPLRACSFRQEEHQPRSQSILEIDGYISTSRES